MIYIVEIPHQSKSKVWSRSNKEDITSAISEAFQNYGETIFEKLTGRQILEQYNCDTIEEFREDYPEAEELADTLEKLGLDTMYYRSFDSDGYTGEPIDAWETYLEYNAHDLQNQMVFMTDEEALEAYRDENRWVIHKGFEARGLLKDELYWNDALSLKELVHNVVDSDDE